MSKRVIVLRIAPLQRIVATEITDPAEQAALMEAYRRAHPKPTRSKARESAKGKRVTANGRSRDKR